MFKSPELPIAEDPTRELRPVDLIAAAALAFAALSFASIGWATFVLPSVRSISPDQLTTATHASSLAPIFLALGGAHAIAAALALSNRRQMRRVLVVAATVGTIAAAALALIALVGDPLAGWSGAAGLSPVSIVPALAAAGYAALAVVERRSATH